MQSNLNKFYSSEGISTWKNIIGEDLHYHFGDFQQTTNFQVGLRNAIRNFYPYIPKGGRILDLGCGWGGPARLLIDELNCKVTGVTISETQYNYCKNEIGFRTHLADIEKMNFSAFEKSYDAVIMIESLEHILEKSHLFMQVKKITNRLIIKTNCLEDHLNVSRWTFDNTMYMCTISELIHDLEQAGWTIELKINRRLHSVPTIKFWKKQLEREIVKENCLNGQLQTLYRLTTSFEANPFGWCRSFPLMDIVANR